MALVNTKKMFKMALKGGYAIGAFNVNNMEITQGIVSAIAEEKAPEPVLMQASAICGPLSTWRLKKIRTFQSQST
jgi:fructose-bisphosphate aldolase class II